jgi:hypothetical protein
MKRIDHRPPAAVAPRRGASGLVAAGWCALACLALLAEGCQAPRSSISVTSYKDPFFPEPYELTFDQAYMGEARDRDQHVVAERVQSAGEDGERVRHLLHLQVFWKPRPGRTFADPSLTDAIARYIVAAPGGTVVYAGSAFVYPRRQPDGTWLFEIEGGTLRLRTVDGDAPESIGDAKLAGMLVATENPGRVVDLRRLMDMYEAGAFAAPRAASPGGATGATGAGELPLKPPASDMDVSDLKDAVLPLEPE